MNLIKELQQQADIIIGKSAYYRDIEIKPITVGQYFQIAPLLAAIQFEGEVTPENVHELVLPQIEKYKDALKDIFDILFKTDIEELHPIDLYNLLGIVNMQMRHEDFIGAITFLSTLSRNRTTDLIANQQKLNEQNSSIQ
jgi:hypothetical protein